MPEQNIEQREQKTEKNVQIFKTSAKAKCNTAGHVLTTPPTILRTSVVAVMLPSGLRLVPATQAHRQADLHLSMIGSFLQKPKESTLIVFNMADLNTSTGT